MEIDKYTFNVAEIPVEVRILGTKGWPNKYELVLPSFGTPTLSLLEEVKSKIITEVVITPTELLDPKIVDSLKLRFSTRAEQVLNELLPSLNPHTKKLLILRLINEMLGLGDIEYLEKDEQLEELVINSSKEPVRVYHKKYGWLITNVTVSTESKIVNYSEIIARRVGRQITTLNPLLDAHLLSGDRANAVLYPISNKGNTITIRKFARDPWTVTDLINSKTCSAEIFALIWLAVQYEMNVLISGGTATGKTTMLNICTAFIPTKHRVISIEDTRELQLPKFLYWAPMTTRLPNPEGQGAVSMLDLLVNALRMRPDRIILGEIRRQAEAEVLFEAMFTGHSVYATVHADSVQDTITRLVNPPISVPLNQLHAVHLNVAMIRDRRRGIRRVFQLGEFIVTDKDTKVSVKPNVLYCWKPSSDKIVKASNSIHLYKELELHTGMTPKEINKNLAEKKKVLEWMVKNKIREVNEVGAVIREYYSAPENLFSVIRQNKGFKALVPELKDEEEKKS